MNSIAADTRSEGQNRASAPVEDALTRVPSRPLSRRRVTALLVGLLLLAPCIVVLALLVGRPWHPTGDLATIDLRVREVWSSSTPLTGLYGRDGWNHPGPVMFWMLSGISVVSRHAAWATRVGGTILQALALGWLVWVASARGLRMLLAAGTTTALLYLGIGADVLRQPWNVYVPIPFFALFIFLVVFAASGSFRQLIGMSIAGTIIVQTYVGYTPLVVAGFAFVLGCVALDVRRDGVAPNRWRSTLVIATAIWLVSWIPPLLGVVVDTPGNFRLLFDYFAAGSHPTVGMTHALGIMSAEFRVLPQWLGGGAGAESWTGFATTAALWWLLVPCALLGAGAAAARRTRSRVDARMVGFAALLLVVSIVAISQADEPRSYSLLWRVLVAAFVVVASCWSIAAAVGPRLSQSYRVAAVAVSILVIAWGCGVRAASETTPADPAAPFSFNHFDRALASLMDQIDVHSLDNRRPILVVPYGHSLPILFPGVVNALDRQGVTVKVARSYAPTYGSRRAATRPRSSEVWYVIQDGSVTPGALAQPGARLVAATDPLVASDDLTRLQQRLGREMRAAGRPELVDALDTPVLEGLTAGVPGIDQRIAHQVGELNRRIIGTIGCRCAIVAVPA